MTGEVIPVGVGAVPRELVVVLVHRAVAVDWARVPSSTHSNASSIAAVRKAIFRIYAMRAPLVKEYHARLKRAHKSASREDSNTTPTPSPHRAASEFR